MATMLEGFGSWLSHPAVQQVGWVLVHFLWQGALVAGALAGALALLRADRARLRYALSLAALIVMMALPLATWWALPAPATPPSTGGSEAAVALQHSARFPMVTAPSGAPAPSWVDTARATVAAGLPGLVLVWLGGVLVLALRMLGGWAHTLRLRRSQSRPVAGTWQRRAEALAEQLGVKPAVRVWQSTRIDVPMVVGWMRPVVLLPVSVLTGLPPEQVEALLAHELAHIRRHDVLVGRLQAVAETLLFYHPAVWWVSRQLRTEREHCCDDLVVQSYGHRVSYAHALTALAARCGRPPEGAMAATDGALLARIRRLVEPAASPPSAKERVTAATALGIVAAVLVTIGACASQQPTAADAEDAGAASTALAAAGEDTTRAEATREEEQRVVFARPDSSEGVAVRVGPEGEAVEWHAFAGGAHDSLDAFSFTAPEEGAAYALFRRYLARPDTIPLPPIPEVPDASFMLHLDSLRPHFFAPPEAPIAEALRDTIDFGAWQEELDALRAGPWGLDTLERERLDSLRRELHRELRAHREEIRRLTRERREEIARLQRERHAQMQAEQSERLREQAEQLRRQAERLEEQAHELEQERPAPDAREREGEGGGANP